MDGEIRRLAVAASVVGGAWVVGVLVTGEVDVGGGTA